MIKEPVLSKDDVLKYWQQHRALTRKSIELFPADELFQFSIGGMRVYGDMIKELISIAVPGLLGIVHHKMEMIDHNVDLNTKEAVLQRWDADTLQIDALFGKITVERFQEEFAVYGDFKLPVIQNIQYFIDNEIHHRAQGYVYLRALGIEPPDFADRY